MNLKLDQIRTDGGTQIRESIDTERVGEYREAMEEGSKFPPVDVHFDGDQYWLSNGFHRYFAARRAGFNDIEVKVHKGTLEDAILFAAGANATHGLPRTNADKRRAVLAVLELRPQWSDNAIAKQCGVSHPTVASVRSSLEKFSSDEPDARTYTTKHGTVATMNTSNIGVRTLASDIGEDEPATPAKQYINGDTGEEIENLVTVTTKREKVGGMHPDALPVVRSAVPGPPKTYLSVPHDPANAADLLIEVFGNEYAASLVSAIREKLCF